MTKNELIQIRISPEEKKKIKALAERHKTNISQVLLAGTRFLLSNEEIAKALLKET